MTNPLESNSITLRSASMQDADILFKWRNDHGTRMASINTDKVKGKEHISWLSQLLQDPNRMLFIAVQGHTPVGTVRADRTTEGHEISWTVAPHARGKGLGKEMVALLTLKIPGKIYARIRRGNTASIRIAEYAGMTYHRREGSLLIYKKETLGEKRDLNIKKTWGKKHVQQ